METTKPQHYQEWLLSAVNPEIIKLNIVSCRGSRPYDYLLISDDIPRRNDGRIRDHILKRYRHIEHGGWWCSGINLLTGELDLWGCFKPDKPRRNPDQPQKRIKYEHPPKTATGVFALQIPLALGQQIARKYGFEPNFISQNKYNWFWQWVINNPEIPIIITEGAKKAGALLSAGYVAIALPGVNSGYRVSVDQWGQNKRELIPELEVLATAGRPFYLSFDQDMKPSTVESVAKAQERLGGLLAQKGADVNVVTWDSGDCKGCDDLIFLHGAAAYEQAYQRALPLSLWRARRLNQLTHQPNISLNQRFLGELTIPAEERLIAIKSAKGTGKTESLIPVTTSAMRAGIRVINLSHRVQLGEALCGRMGLNYISEVRNSEEGDLFGYGLCVDSLHPHSQAQFCAEDWEGCIVILDEAEQLLWHLLNSSTCMKHRVAILRQFKALLQKASQVYIADADLSDLSIEYLSNLMGNVEPYLIVNEYKPVEESWDVYRYSKPEHLIEAVFSEIEAGGKPFICCSAQKEKSLWGTQNLEGKLLEKFPQLRILRIDSQSVSDPTHPATGCIKEINNVLLCYDVVISSPSIETGISVDITNHFTGVFALAQGITAPNSVRQSLARVREPVPRHVYAAPMGLAKVGNGGLTWRDLRAGQSREFKSNIKLLKAADLTGLEESLDDPSSSQIFQPESLKAWAKFACRHNASMVNYAEQIFAGLLEEGHRIMLMGGDGADLKEELFAFRDKLYSAECLAISNARPFSCEQEYLASKEKRAKTKEERRRERHWQLRKRYGEVTPELVELDDKGCYHKLRLHYYLTLGRAHLPARDAAKAKEQLEYGQGKLFVPDFNRSQLGSKIGALEILGIPQLLGGRDSKFTNADEELLKLHSLVTAPLTSWQLRQLGLGSYKPSDSPMKVFKGLLRHLHITPVRVGRESRGERHWIYQLSIPERDNLFALWLERDEASAKSSLAMSPPNPSQSGKYIKETLHLDHTSEDNASEDKGKAREVISQLDAAAPEALRGLVERCVRSQWWAEIRDIVWVSVTVFVRQVIDELDFEERYGF
ncbi:MAG: DUF3854 domain-containing protein [Symploca sp. SIO2E9]|nr:DUF3854 domain-containing protein [Symploca sp. SIO2E9]